jgi:uncharacterized protein (DUF362 family)
MTQTYLSDELVPVPPAGLSRRAILAIGGAAAAGVAAARSLSPRWRKKAPVCIARGQRYDSDLVQTIREALVACGISADKFHGRRVLLKPNLVEPSRHIPHMTTHPAVVVAAAEVFRGFGAEVVVGEAPGHMRDSLFVLEESGMGPALRRAGVPFVDLNYEDVTPRPNRGGLSGLETLYFPRSVSEADFVVSIPKLKTHHWVGMTAAMKNLYGILPGIKYGWPKNVLHHNGIPQTVVDINRTVPTTLAIVDAIDCMEGDGPILGSCKPMGLILVGGNLTALDATAARIMHLAPERISYLALAKNRLGPLDERLIEQRGEAWRSVASPFAILPEEHLKRLRAFGAGELLT